MDFFISNAWAQAPAGQPDPFMSFLPLILIFVIFYFLLIRPQSKRAKEHKKMVSELKAGDEVVTGGGLLGKITEVGEQFIKVEVADGVVLKVQRQTVVGVMPKGTFKSV
jgi:preprotein translocase subunit YajC